MKTLVLLLAFTLTPAGHGQLQRDADAITRLGVVGVQAEVLSAGRHSIVTSGTADLKAPMPRQGRFRIASTRKAMVAVVVLQLVAEHKLKLSDNVEKWLPETKGRGITVRHLLQNTAGLHDDVPGYTTPQEYLEQRYDVHTRNELIARSLKHSPDFEPGTKWAYSNTGFLLLDALVEKVSGRPLEHEIRRRIAEPLGLRSLSWPKTSPSLPNPHAQAYQVFPGGDRVDVTEQVSSDPDGVLGTTRDLTVFFQALLDGRLLPEAQLRQMQQTVPVDSGTAQFMPGARYGLGLISRPLPCGGVYWGHDGGDAGFITVTGVTEDGRRSVVVSMNTALGGSAEQPLQQQRAADTLVEHALCS
jgi:D-alanyl-D-alanine carboxypeptidase